MQRLMEYCSPAQMEGIAEDLLSSALVCCCDKYGKYVMQSLLEHGMMPQVRQLMDCLAQNAHRLAAHEHGCCVIGKSMCTGLLEERVRIGEAIYSVPGLVQSLSSAEGRFVARAIQAVMSKAGNACVEPRGQGKTSVAKTGAIHSISGVNSRRGKCGGAPAQEKVEARTQKKSSTKHGKGGGASAQKEAEARDLLESLRAACARRNPGKIAKALDRVQRAFSTAWASPALHIEALQCCEHARHLMWALSIEIGNYRLYV